MKAFETPLMKQYSEMKKKHPDAVLLFRVGDFYETFSEDAVLASDILGITLVRRANGSARFIELAGFPHHAIDTYLPKLIRAGKRVAICEQLDDSKIQKTKILREKVAELITPNPLIQSSHDIELLNTFIWIFSAFGSVINKLYLFDKIQRKTREIQSLASTLGISPMRAFEECSAMQQPSLFD